MKTRPALPLATGHNNDSLVPTPRASAQPAFLARGLNPAPYVGGDPLPTEVVAALTVDSFHDSNLDYGMSTYGRRDIDFEIPGVSDDVLFWEFPDCGGQWQGFDITPCRAKDMTTPVSGSPRLCVNSWPSPRYQGVS